MLCSLLVSHTCVDGLLSLYGSLMCKMSSLNAWLGHHSAAHPSITPPSSLPFLFPTEFAAFIDHVPLELDFCLVPNQISLF